jgi:hypothetical protein
LKQADFQYAEDRDCRRFRNEFGRTAVLTGAVDAGSKGGAEWR